VRFFFAIERADVSYGCKTALQEKQYEPRCKHQGMEVNDEAGERGTQHADKKVGLGEAEKDYSCDEYDE